MLSAFTLEHLQMLYVPWAVAGNLTPGNRSESVVPISQDTEWAQHLVAKVKL